MENHVEILLVEDNPHDIKLAIHNHGKDSVYGTPEKVWSVLKDRDARIGVCMDVGHLTGAPHHRGVEGVGTHHHDITEAGGVVTAATCGACSGGHMGVLGAGETCITASTRNFKGRMGDPGAKIYMGSPATVAASAIKGVIADPREFLP